MRHRICEPGCGCICHRYEMADAVLAGGWDTCNGCFGEVANPESKRARLNARLATRRAANKALRRAAVVAGIALSLVACSSDETVKAPEPIRVFTDLTSVNTGVTLGDCSPHIDGGELVVRTDLDGMRTVENLDLALGDCVVATGVVTNLHMRLGIQSEETRGWRADWLVDWDLFVDGQYLPLPTFKLPVEARFDEGVVHIEFAPALDVPGLVNFTGLEVYAAQ